MAHLFWLVTLSTDVRREANIPPALPVSKPTRLTTEAPGTAPPCAAPAQDQPQVICPPRSQSALRLHGGLKSRQRALSVYRAWSRGHQNQRLLLISIHLLAIRHVTAQLLLLISFTYSYTNYLVSLNLLFQLPLENRSTQHIDSVHLSKKRQHSPERFT